MGNVGLRVRSPKSVIVSPFGQSLFGNVCKSEIIRIKAGRAAVQDVPPSGGSQTPMVVSSGSIFVARKRLRQAALSHTRRGHSIHHVRTTENVPASTAGSFHRLLDLLFCFSNCFSEHCRLGKVQLATRTHLLGPGVVRVHRTSQGNTHRCRVRSLLGFRGTGGRVVRIETQSR